MKIPKIENLKNEIPEIENFENRKFRKMKISKNIIFKNFVVWPLIVMTFWFIVADFYYSRTQKKETPDSEL